MRLFVGVDCSGQQKGLRALQSSLPAATQLEDTHHLTLKFLGEVPRWHLPTIMQRLATVEHEKFDLNITHLGQYTHEKGHTIIWAGTDNHEHLLRLQEKIDRQVASSKKTFPAFVPHLPLGRITNGKKTARKEELTKHITIPVKAFHLYESKPNNYRKRYRIVKSFALK